MPSYLHHASPPPRSKVRAFIHTFLVILVPFVLAFLASWFFTRRPSKKMKTKKKKTLGQILPDPRDGAHQALLEPIPRCGVLIVGDVHGCLSELQALIHRHRVQYPEMPVVFVGDIVNKGPFSAECVAFIRSLPCSYAVRGNHDDEALRHIFLATKTREPPPERYQWTQKLSVPDVEWLQNLPYSLAIPALGVLVVHAGIDPGTPLANQSAEVMTTTRGWAHIYDGRHGFIVFGHDARSGLQQHSHAWGIDTGCVYGRRLSAARVWVEGEAVQRELVSVDALDVYEVHKG